VCSSDLGLFLFSEIEETMSKNKVDIKPEDYSVEEAVSDSSPHVFDPPEEIAPITPTNLPTEEDFKMAEANIPEVVTAKPNLFTLKPEFIDARKGQPYHLMINKKVYAFTAPDYTLELPKEAIPLAENEDHPVIKA
jgi:hypothetical protein